MRELFSTAGGRTFAVVWAGQLLSHLGSGMTSFGLAIWVFQETGSASQLALIVIAARVPMLLVSPFAGSLIDRWDRRVAMIVSDTGAAVATLVTIGLLATGWLEIWHLYVTLSVAGLFTAFQFPAYSAAITGLVPKEQYGRASGLVQLANSAGNVAAPALAAVVVTASGLTALFAIDLITFGLAVGALALVRFPAYDRAPPSGRGVLGLVSDARVGFDFVLAKRALLILLLSFLVVNFAFSFQSVLLVPLLLGLGSEAIAGTVVSLGSLGIVAGSLAISVWGVPRNRVSGVYSGILAMGLGLIVAGSRPSVAVVLIGIAIMNITHPVAASSSQAIWQAKVPPQLQGRVFAVRQMAAIAATPIAFLLAGVLADRVFEPLFSAEAPPTLLGALIGTGEGRGIGFVFVLTGIVVVATVVIAWRSPRIRHLDVEVPDLEEDHVPAAA